MLLFNANYFQKCRFFLHLSPLSPSIIGWPDKIS